MDTFLIGYNKCHRLQWHDTFQSLKFGICLIGNEWSRKVATKSTAKSKHYQHLELIVHIYQFDWAKSNQTGNFVIFPPFRISIHLPWKPLLLWFRHSSRTTGTVIGGEIYITELPFHIWIVRGACIHNEFPASHIDIQTTARPFVDYQLTLLYNERNCIRETVRLLTPSRICH